MAEKEERIYLFTDKLICENCKDWYEHIDPLDSPDCTECAPADFPYITRQEAIERMAKAICMKKMFGCERCYYEKNKEKCEAWVAFNYMNGAEAALNALLEDK